MEVTVSRVGGGLQRGRGQGYRCHHMITPTLPKTTQDHSLEVTQESQLFIQPMPARKQPNTHCWALRGGGGGQPMVPGDRARVPHNWLWGSLTRKKVEWDLLPASTHIEGAETHRALHRAHCVRQRMQRFSAMYTLSEGRQGRGESTLKWETFVHASSPLPPR